MAGKTKTSPLEMASAHIQEKQTERRTKTRQVLMLTNRPVSGRVGGWAATALAFAETIHSSHSSCLRGGSQLASPQPAPERLLLLDHGGGLHSARNVWVGNAAGECGEGEGEIEGEKRRMRGKAERRETQTQHVCARETLMIGIRDRRNKQ